MTGTASWLLEPPINVVRLALHPEGIASRIVNYGEWRVHMIERLMHQVDLTAEIRSYPISNKSRNQPGRNSALASTIAIPLQSRTNTGVLSFISTTTVFGTPIDVTLSEIAIETFLPADEQTAELLGNLPP